MITIICIFENSNYTSISFESLRSENNFYGDLRCRLDRFSFFLILIAVPLSGTATDLDKDEIISKRATEEESRAAIGQGGAVAGTGAIWRDLRDNAAVLKAEIVESLYRELSVKADIYTKILFKRINKYKNMGERR